MNIPTLISRLSNSNNQEYYYRDFYISLFSLIVYSYDYNNLRISKLQYSTINRFLTNDARFDTRGRRTYDVKYLFHKNVKSNFFKSIKWYMFYNFSENEIIPYLPENELETNINRIDIYQFQLYIKEYKLYIHFTKAPFIYYRTIESFIDHFNTVEVNAETKLFYLNFLFKIEELLSDKDIINDWIICYEYTTLDNITAYNISKHKNNIYILKERVILLIENYI